MKKASRSSGPSKQSLRALPEIDFDRYQVRRNRFALRVKREGIQLLHDEPSAASLAEIPEIDLTTAVVRRRKPLVMQVGKGRPRRGDEVGATTSRSIRLPDAVWRSLELVATRQRLTVHALLRTAVVRYLARPSLTNPPVAAPRTLAAGRRAR